MLQGLSNRVAFSLRNTIAMSTQTIPVLFVCAGNICRSPMAEAVFRHIVNEAGLAHRFDIASVGTGNWHVGEPPHPGTQAVLQRNGIDFGDKCARHLKRADLGYYTYILAMDSENMVDIGRLGRPARGEVRRLTDFARPGAPLDVPDPYYTGNFAEVYALVTEACQGLLDHICEREGLVC